jgi:predicted homoserine dehydrogenase-like protein
MIILDTALGRRAAEGRPVRIALVGAGYIVRGIAAHALHMPGIELVAVANRTLARAAALFQEQGREPPATVESAEELDAAVARGVAAITSDPAVVCAADSVEVVLEATGEVELGARTVLDAIAHAKHVVLLNAELDATVGSLLKTRADAAGVVITHTDGEEPAVAMSLIRYLRTIGLHPVLAGNIKGLLDRRRTPETQRAFAASVGQDAKKVASYADGTKLSLELAILANATGFGVARRGMNGYRCAHVDELSTLYGREPRLDGMVDYCLGAAPGSGVFVVCRADNETARTYLEHFKLGKGPLYVFYTPWHLPQAEAPLTAARAVLFGDAAVAPLGAPRCEVFAVAKRDLKAGEVLDGAGGFTCYGSIDNADVAREERLLPIGVSSGCTLTRGVRVDSPITYDDVSLPRDRLIDRLRAEQDATFGPARSAAPG